MNSNICLLIYVSAIVPVTKKEGYTTIRVSPEVCASPSFVTTILLGI